MENVNKQLLNALKMVLDDPDALDGRPRTYQCVKSAIAAAQQQAEPVEVHGLGTPNVDVSVHDGKVVHYDNGPNLAEALARLACRISKIRQLPAPTIGGPRSIVAVPDGYVLVPVEPTEEMKACGNDVLAQRWGASDAYRAMLAAAQKGGA